MGVSLKLFGHDLWFPRPDFGIASHLGVDAAGLEGCFLVQTLGKDAIVSMFFVSPQKACYSYFRMFVLPIMLKFKITLTRVQV